MEEIIFKSRKIILNMLHNRGYNISYMTNLSLKEIEIMYENDSCNFELRNLNNGKLLKVVYLFDKNRLKNLMKKQFFDKIINVLDSCDEAIFILPEDDSDNILQDICNDYYDRFNKYSQVFFYKRMILLLLPSYRFFFHKDICIH